MLARPESRRRFFRRCGTRPAPSDAALLLLNGRFRATLRARDLRTGRTAEGVGLPKADGFGYFGLPGFTGDPTFPEVFVKMTDGRALPGSYVCVPHRADLEYTLTVTDLVTGASKTYSGRPGDAPRLCGGADTAAFR